MTIVSGSGGSPTPTSPAPAALPPAPPASVISSAIVRFLTIWGAPAVTLVIVGLAITMGSTWLTSRFTTVEDRMTRLETNFSTLNTGMDSRFTNLGKDVTDGFKNVRDRQGFNAWRARKAQSDGSAENQQTLTDLRDRVGRIGAKLHVASADTDGLPGPELPSINTQPTDTPDKAKLTAGNVDSVFASMALTKFDSTKTQAFINSMTSKGIKVLSVGDTK